MKPPAPHPHPPDRKRYDSLIGLRIGAAAGALLGAAAAAIIGSGLIVLLLVGAAIGGAIGYRSDQS